MYTTPGSPPPSDELDWLILDFAFTGTRCVSPEVVRNKLGQALGIVEKQQFLAVDLKHQIEQANDKTTVTEQTLATTEQTLAETRHQLAGAQEKAGTSTAVAFAAVVLAAMFAVLLVRSTRRLRAATRSDPDLSEDDQAQVIRLS